MIASGRTYAGRIGLMLVALAAAAPAQAPEFFNYQARLVDGSQLYNGTATIVFGLYGQRIAGAPLYLETQTVAVVDGLYSTSIGASNPVPGSLHAVLETDPVYLQVTVNGTPLSPRERLGSVAYAMRPGLKGLGNVESGVRSAVGGGETNTASGAGSGVSGGSRNEAAGDYSAVAGGRQNTASNSYAFVGGGWLNEASGPRATVAGGGGNTATGAFAAIPGGRLNAARGDYSFAAGHNAQAAHAGAFVWADALDVPFASTASNQFLVRARGGVGINTNIPGAALGVNGEVRVSQAVFAESFVGDGSGLVNLRGQGITPGTVSNAQLAANAVAGPNIAANAVTLGTQTLGDYVMRITAGAGIEGSAAGEGSVPELSVNVDGATLEIQSDSLQVKTGGVASAHLAAGSVTSAKIGPNAVTLGPGTTGDYVENVTAGEGLSGTAWGEGSHPTLDVNVDNATLEIAADTLRVKASGIQTAHIATGAVGRVQIASGAVGTAQLGAGAVISANLAAGAVTSNHLAPGAVTTASLAQPYRAGSFPLELYSGGAHVLVGCDFPTPFAATPIVTLGVNMSEMDVGLAPGAWITSKSADGFAATISAPDWPDPPQTVVADTSDDVDMAIVNGNPALVYSTKSGDLGYVRASSAYGADWDTPVTAADEGDYGTWAPVMTIVDGNPAIGYRRSKFLENDVLMYVRATNSSGSAWGTSVPVLTASSGQSVQCLNMAVVNGRPAFALALTAVFSTEMAYVRAEDGQGSAWGTKVLPAPGAFVYDVSMDVIDSCPAIAYADYGSGDAKYVRAGDFEGTSWGTPVTAAAGTRVYSVDLGTVNAYPAIAYVDYPGGSGALQGNLHFVRAADATGTTWSAAVTVDASGLVQSSSPSMAVIDGKPMIVYRRSYGGFDVMACVHAADINGTRWNAPAVLDLGGDSGHGARLKDIWDRPAIGYTAGRNPFDVKFARLQTATGRVDWIAIQP